MVCRKHPRIFFPHHIHEFRKSGNCRNWRQLSDSATKLGCASSNNSSNTNCRRCESVSKRSAKRCAANALPTPSGPWVTVAATHADRALWTCRLLRRFRNVERELALQQHFEKLRLERQKLSPTRVAEEGPYVPDDHSYRKEVGDALKQQKK